MEEQNMLDQHMPVYNIKAVSRLLGLLPVTLRAWERRYGLPSPHRGGQGYRLYSEYDLRTLRWLKAQNDSGMSIGRAVEYLNELRISGRDPAVDIQAPPHPERPASLKAMTLQLQNALTRFDEGEASEIMRRAFALYSIDQVLIEIVQPTLIEMGEAWHRGELPIAVEHYATQYCMQHLMGMISGAMPPFHNGTIVAACAPGEMHQIGLLMLVVMLRWRGWDVKYLGPDLKLERMEEALGPLHPRMLLFTATRQESAAALAELPTVLKNFPHPQPVVVLGGQAFQNTRLPESVAAVYLNAAPSETVKTIERMLMETRSEPVYRLE